MKYLDAVSLAKLRGLRLVLRRLACEGQSSGRHKSWLKGFSRDFAQHRSYAPGDALKDIDWKVLARQDRFFVKEYSAESMLQTQLLVDASGSMGFAACGRESKYDHACRLAASLAYLILEQGDAVGLTVFDAELRARLSPRAALAHLELIDATLAAAAPRGETALGLSVERAAAALRRRSLVILISDLLGEPEETAKVVRSLRARRHEVMVLQVLDPRERELDYAGGPVAFESLETGERLVCDPDALRVRYRAEFERGQRLFESSFQHSEVRHQLFYTDQPWDKALGRFLSGVR